jgi:hypothetical protein
MQQKSQPRCGKLQHQEDNLQAGKQEYPSLPRIAKTSLYRIAG